MTYPARRSAGLFLVLSGPSGAGKSTLIQHFLAGHPQFVRCLSVTTRAPRGQECEGVDYFFTDAEAFRRRAAAGEFLEHAEVFGRFYGTPRSFVTDHLAAGRGVIKDMDVQGAATLRQTFPEAVQVFTAPADRAEIERRLRSRGTDSDDVIACRLAEADAELAQWRRYDYLVINDDLERAVADLAAIVRAELTAVVGSRGRGVAGSTADNH